MTRTIEAGERIGDSTVEAALGEGGFGSVYRVRLPSGQQRAIKVAHEATEAMSTVELGMLQNEIEAVLRLRHQSLVQTYRYGYLDDGRLYLVMELVEGISLIDHIDRHETLDPVEALAIVDRVAEVMAYCHEQGVLHLDLKPENIVITDRHDPRLKVLDFGVARLARAWRGQKVIAGTPAYMAPEAFGDGPREPSMDVYALGVSLHVMLTGCLAFADDGMTAQIEEKYAGPPPLDTVAWAQAPAGLRTLLHSMLAADPAQRPSMAAVRREVRRLYFSALVGERGKGTVEITSPAPSQPIQVTQLFGREAQLEQLRERWAKAQLSACGPTLLLGAQGLGKSALVDRFLEEYGQEPALVADGRCRESGDLVPFASIREAAGRLAQSLRELPNWRALGIELRHSLGPLESVLIALVPEAQPPGSPPADPTLLRPGPELVARAVFALLEVVVRHRPVMLVLEDLQWAGGGVHEVIQYLSSQPLVGVFILVTARERPAWAYGVDTIELPNLAPVDNNALLRALLATDDASIVERLVAQIPVLGAGIPVATVQVTADLQLQRCVRRLPDGGLELDEERLTAYVPPATIADVLERRLSRLDPRARRILGIGALMGRRFERDDIVATEMFGPYQVQAAMLDAHLLGLAQVQDGRCQLAHDVLVDRLAAEWEPHEARSIHARIADVLGLRGTDPGRRAHHLERAGQEAGAAVVHLQAAHHADELHHLVGAERHFRRAVELAGELPLGTGRTDILREAIFGFARVAGALGHLDDGFAVAKIAADALARDQGAGPEDFAVHSALARLHYIRGDMTSAVALGRRCLEIAGDSATTRRYRVLPANLVGRALYVRGRYGEAAVALARGCQLAAAEDESMELCHSLGMLGLSLGYTGVLDEARAHLRRATALAEELGDPVRRLASLCYVAIEADYRHDWEQGIISSAEALTFAQEHEIDGLYHCLSLVVAGRHQFHVGQLSRARLLLEHAVELARRQGLSIGVGWAHSFLGDIALVQGDYEQASESYEQGLAAGEQDEYAKALNLVGRAHLRALWRGDRSQFDDDANRAMARLAAADNVATQAHAHLRHSDALVALGDEAAAAQCREQAQAIFARLGIDPVGWWPIPPADFTSGSAREYWQWKATRQDEHDAAPARPTLALVRRVTQRINEQAQALRTLEPTPGGMKPA